MSINDIAKEEINMTTLKYEFETWQSMPPCTSKNKAKDNFYDYVCKFIMNEVGDKCTRKQAEVIWSYAYEDRHPFGWFEIECYLNKYIEFTKCILNS